MKLRMTALTLLSLLALGQANAAEVRLLNVSYDPTRELFQEYNSWLITSCRSANNIMPITIFLPAGTASFFYSA